MSEDSAQFCEYAIPSLLAPFVKSIWSMENSRTHDCARERILPDGCVELVMHFRDPFQNHLADGTTDLQPASFVVGQMKHFLEIEPTGATGFMAVRFPARGAYLFLRPPMSEVAGSVVPLSQVWDDRANEYTERVTVARDMATRVRIIEAMLLEALRTNGRRDHAVERCVELIQNSVEPTSVKELGSIIGLSTRQLARRFQNVIGMSPKEFVRVNRFIRAAHRLRVHARASLTETAYDCGYFDQAHFNHEFRRFAGMTPGEFIAAENVAI
jgi:AraC-like DNA-binding protein